LELAGQKIDYWKAIKKALRSVKAEGNIKDMGSTGRGTSFLSGLMSLKL